jgi:hypothetical protein
MVKFVPVWITVPGELPSVTENTPANITLSATRRATFMAADGQNVVDVNGSAPYITSITVNSISSSDYTVVGNSVVFSSPLLATDVVSISTSEQITYSLLHDSLPPGLLLSNTGVINGTVGSLLTTANSITYSFGVRISDGSSISDHQFSIEADTNAVQTSPPGWGNLPSKAVQQATPAAFTYVPLGQAIRGSLFQFQLDLFVPSGLPPTLVLEFFLDATDITSPFNAFPPGLVIDSHTGLISGELSPSADIGQYFFKIKMLDGRGNPITTGTGATPLTFMIDVAPPLEALAPLRFIVWSTPAGSLCTIYEGQTFPIGVSATCTTGEAVTYTLQSGILPNGLTLDSSSGNIIGTLGHLSGGATYPFTIRAFVGQTFEDRVFSITVVARYSSSNFLNMNFRLRVPDTSKMIGYYQNLIDDDQYFRSTDPNFPSVTVGNNPMLILVIGGLEGVISDFEPIVRASNYKGPVNLLLGQHKIAYAVLNGKVVYEVLYRDIVDPLDGAGDFTVNNGVPTPTPVEYPESNPSAPTFIYPSSIDNIRYEFLNVLGFPTSDPTLTMNVEVASNSENLPLWMMCPQSGNDPTTALGYIPAVVLAYLQPGQGAPILNRINALTVPSERPTDPTNPIALGHQMQFDQYYVVFQTVSKVTTFDNATTTFDGAKVVFDIFEITGGQYFRLNRNGINTI